ncbi:MAG: cell division protein FtsA [Thermovirgaceae bacterium]
MEKKPKDPELFAGLDIGTKKTAILVAEKTSQRNERHIIGVGKARTRGIKKGKILEPEAVIESIRNALDDVEEMIGLHVGSAYLTTGTHPLRAFRCEGALELGESQDTITVTDVRKVIQAAIAAANPVEGDTILHAFPLDYRIDGEIKTADPVGEKGSHLKVRVLCLSVPESDIRLAVQCAEKAGLHIMGVVHKTIASAFGAFQEEDLEKGALAVDSGGGTTSFTLVHEGKPFHAGIFPIGGDHITNDLTYILKLPPSKAEMLKRLIAVNEPEENWDDELEFDIRGEPYVCTVGEILDVERPRIAELWLDLVRAEIERYIPGKMPLRVVLSGGVGKTQGMFEYLGELLDTPVRPGKPVASEAMPPDRNGIEFTTVAGILQYVQMKEKFPYRFIDPQGKDGVPKPPDRDFFQSQTARRIKKIRSNRDYMAPVKNLVDAFKKTLKELF